MQKFYKASALFERLARGEISFAEFRKEIASVVA